MQQGCIIKILLIVEDDEEEKYIRVQCSACNNCENR